MKGRADENQGRSDGNTMFQRRAKVNWAEMVGSMMSESRVLKRGEAMLGRSRLTGDAIRIRYCRV